MDELQLLNHRVEIIDRKINILIKDMTKRMDELEYQLKQNDSYKKY